MLTISFFYPAFKECLNCFHLNDRAKLVKLIDIRKKNEKLFLKKDRLSISQGLHLFSYPYFGRTEAMRASSSEVKVVLLIAWRLSSNCATLLAPIITLVTSFARSHDIAI